MLIGKDEAVMILLIEPEKKRFLQVQLGSLLACQACVRICM